jgi:hypothetical protein
VDSFPAPAPKNKSKANGPHKRRNGVRHFFDNAEYIAIRLFVFAMLLIKLVDVIRASLK